MGYVEETLGPNERVVHVSRFHWTYTASAWGLILLFGWTGILLFVGLWMLIKKWTTEIAVTDRRFVYKRGWIARQTEEVSLSRIEEVNVQQGVIGRLLDFGRLRLGGTGMGSIETPTIDDPIGLRRAINEAREGSPAVPD